MPDKPTTKQTYKCVSCGHIVKTKELSSIRCPKCSYKGLELVEPTTDIRKKIIKVLPHMYGDCKDCHKDLDRLEKLLKQEQLALLERLEENIPEMEDGQYWPCKNCGFDGEKALSIIQQEKERLK